MAEAAIAGAPPAQPEAALLATLDALRSAGAQDFDPARFRFLQLLAQRMDAEPPAVRCILHGKLEQGLATLSERLRQAQRLAVDAPDAARASCPRLADLNHYIRTTTMPAARPGGDGEDATELKSLRRFRESWSRMAAEDQVDQAVVRGPDNAGPLNSHSLVLRSLALMRDLSPDYLRRFLSFAEALLWLEQAGRPTTEKTGKAKPARRAKTKI